MQQRMSLHQLAAATSVLIAAMVLAVPLLPGGQNNALALALAAIGLWATGAIPEYITALAFFTFAMLFKVAAPGVIFGGFESAALWLIFGGLGALVDKSGLGSLLAEAIVKVVPLAPNAPAMNFASLSAVSTVVGLATTLPGVPAVLTPLAAQMSQISGLPLESVLMSQVLGFSNPLLPYESAPLVVAMQLGGERQGPAQLMCILLAAATIFLLLPLDFFWWRLLGWI